MEWSVQRFIVEDGDQSVREFLRHSRGYKTVEMVWESTLTLESHFNTEELVYMVCVVLLLFLESKHSIGVVQYKTNWESSGYSRS